MRRVGQARSTANCTVSCTRCAGWSRRPPARLAAGCAPIRASTSGGWTTPSGVTQSGATIPTVRSNSPSAARASAPKGGNEPARSVGCSETESGRGSSRPPDPRIRSDLRRTGLREPRVEVGAVPAQSAAQTADREPVLGHETPEMAHRRAEVRRSLGRVEQHRLARSHIRVHRHSCNGARDRSLRSWDVL